MFCNKKTYTLWLVCHFGGNTTWSYWHKYPFYWFPKQTFVQPIHRWTNLQISIHVPSFRQTYKLTKRLNTGGHFIPLLLFCPVTMGYYISYHNGTWCGPQGQVRTQLGLLLTSLHLLQRQEYSHSKYSFIKHWCLDTSRAKYEWDACLLLVVLYNSIERRWYVTK